MPHLMRNLGAFFGHIARAVKEDPARPKDRTEVRRTVEKEDRGDMILRRTVIDEVEFKQGKAGGGQSDREPTMDK